MGITRMCARHLRTRSPSAFVTATAGLALSEAAHIGNCNPSCDPSELDKVVAMTAGACCPPASGPVQTAVQWKQVSNQVGAQVTGCKKNKAPHAHVLFHKSSQQSWCNVWACHGTCARSCCMATRMFAKSSSTILRNMQSLCMRHRCVAPRTPAMT